LLPTRTSDLFASTQVMFRRIHSACRPASIHLKALIYSCPINSPAFISDQSHVYATRSTDHALHGSPYYSLADFNNGSIKELSLAVFGIYIYELILTVVRQPYSVAFASHFDRM
jgi:hypothetical protein